MNFTLEPPKHGGDLAVWQRREQHADHWLDLSSACNREPWPIPEELLQSSAKLWYELPDQFVLEQAATDYFGQAPLAIGAGTQQFIEILPALLLEKGALEKVAHKKVLVPAVGYQEHGYSWRKWGYEVSEYQDVSELLNTDWDIAVVISPNNPSGQYLSLQESEQLKVLLESSERHLVLDEAFLDATPEQSWLNGPLPRGCFVLRSVGKFFGLAGARVGFIFGDQSFQTAIQSLLGPWPVATPALHLVTKALQDTAWQAEALESLAERHAYFIDSVVPKLNTLFDSQAMQHTPLFFTWQLEPEQAQKAFQALHSVGIHIRLGEGWVRVSLPAGHEMQRLNNGLVRLLQGHQLKELG
ncbi:aminotransferase class I/II-fold pyridoxal phosphate-dependent enzyme [Marinomonas ostreistagni]|uniref:aminotransferase class I/II-fold pyridoxal phosphate-dependent enzyme n=1 Tax=Marinomonas ostreistagni TaxID=359209 RepID=UPI00194FC857|nr:aminotransferase class I/II-fold pyridoxal phosphate-dependent enzyme [Marinomonas ostreistagni]MBM6551091.1 aminotransferase class I/II-fold pyridoxal phosphate-dependent enzyme [Marinomonas ostreistagni]